jgi:hypothetical protein
VQVRLQADLAKRSPGAALKEMQRHHDPDEDRDPSRTYERTGYHTVKREMPRLLARISDDTTTDLSPVEAAAKEFRDSLIADQGGRQNLTTAKQALITSATGSWVILQTVDAFIFELAMTRGLVSKRARRTWPIVETRARLADSFARQLGLIGMEKRAAPQTLAEIIEAAKSETNGHNGNGDH